MTIVDALDQDLYMWLMSQPIWRRFPDLEVRYRFFNRGTARLLAYFSVAEIEQAINEALDISYSDEDLQYLASLRCFDPDYIDSLRSFKKPVAEAWESKRGLEIQFEGLWHEQVFAEDTCMYVVSELYNERNGTDKDWLVGDQKLDVKIEFWQQHPELKFFDFGLRRRASQAWHQHVIERLSKETPNNLAGTSCVRLSKLLGVPARGTQAHALYMILGAIYGPVKAQDIVMQMWAEEYLGIWDNHLMIMLPDTISSRFALSNMNALQASQWYGFRNDSGNPFEWTDLILEQYKQWGLDPQTKLLGYSNALDQEKHLQIYNYLAARADSAAGIGTNLTNDRVIEALNIVVKPTHVKTDRGWKSCIKISDDPEKATALDHEAKMQMQQWLQTIYKGI